MHHPSCLCSQACTCCMRMSNIACMTWQRVLCRRCRGDPALCLFCSRCVFAPDEKHIHKGHCNAASAATYLGKGAGIKVPLPCIVSQRPHLSQYRTRQLTPLKELDSIWPSQLVVMIYTSKLYVFSTIDSDRKQQQRHSLQHTVTPVAKQDVSGKFQSMLGLLCAPKPQCIAHLCLQAETMMNTNCPGQV
jgi:hypothetical protein